MKATEANLLDFLKKSPQFVIPIYPRTYSWGEQQCQQLWDDILRAGRSEEISAHFIGSIVYIEEGLYQVSRQSPLLVIDGQQRLATVTLIKESPLRLNEGLGELSTWDEAAIKERAQRLATKAVKVWSPPWLPDDVLDTYRTKTETVASYTLDDDHPYLATGAAMRPLFEAFRKEVLALDPGITEEILKLYIAYKAETNFVDVVPQKSRLRLTLNMKFHELHDPKGLAQDVTNKGRWGNGDVEVGLSKADELPYVMGLVRQSFEKQMDDGEDG